MTNPSLRQKQQPQQQQLTQQQEVEQIIKEMMGTNRHLYDKDFRNELALRYYARHVPKLSKKLYEDKTLADRANRWTSIEYIDRYAHSLLEKPKNPGERTKWEQITDGTYAMMTRDQKVVVDEMRRAQSLGIPLESYINGTLFVLRCWRSQDADFDQFLRENDDIIDDIMTQELARPASITRYTRFIRKEAEKKYGGGSSSRPSPSLAAFAMPQAQAAETKC